LHRVKVRHEWLTKGEVIELELPRNLACAGCGGGGCDACGRSGAITLRRRDEPAEGVEITLPARTGDDAPDSRGLTLRIPEQGGLPEPGSDLPRGLLLLTVVPSPEPDRRVRLLRGVPSKGPPATVVEGEDLPPALSRRPPASPWSLVLIAVTAAVVVWVLLLIWLRLSGRG
jgi:hypothetical protein